MAYIALRMSGDICLPLFFAINFFLASVIISLLPDRPAREIARERRRVSVCDSFFFLFQPRLLAKGENKLRTILFTFSLLLVLAKICSSWASPAAISIHTV